VEETDWWANDDEILTNLGGRKRVYTFLSFMLERNRSPHPMTAIHSPVL